MGSMKIPNGANAFIDIRKLRDYALDPEHRVGRHKARLFAALLNMDMDDEINLLDVVALTKDVPEHALWRGEVGAVVACYPNDAYEIEFVAQDGYTYALVVLRGSQIVSLKQKRIHSDVMAESFAL
jgi:hypothetical protein